MSIRTGNGRKPLILNRISIQKDNAFTEGEKTEFQGSKSWISYRRKRRKPEERQKRQDGSCQRKRSIPLSVSLMKKTGRAKYVLTAVKRKKPFKPDSPVKRMAGRAGSEFTNYAHGKVAEVEKENAGVEAHTKVSRKPKMRTAL